MSELEVHAGRGLMSGEQYKNQRVRVLSVMGSLDEPYKELHAAQ